MARAWTGQGGALVTAGLVDELLLYVAPSLIGDGGRGLLSLPGAKKLSDRVELEILEMRAVGKDWRITACPKIS
jgi:diaminohydroxyphosphoribosylaminopyrimidine deaminase/5-amino-6-(5-phosphoribosylamino)uracil reductase